MVGTNPAKLPDKSSQIKQAFTDLNRKFEEQETQRQAMSLGLPYFDLIGFPIETAALGVVAREQAQSAEAIIFFREGPLLKVGVVDQANQNLRILLADLEKKKYQPELYLVSRSALSLALQQYNKILHVTSSKKHEVIVSAGDSILEGLKNLADLGERLLSMPITDVLSLVIGGAVTMNASDIHLEPEKNVLKVRFRVDGVLQDVVYLPQTILHPILSRIKLLSGLKLNITAAPQDGRFSIKQGEKKLDIRVSVLPSAFGESVVMRLLGMSELKVEIENLGLRALALKVVEQELKKPNGMILTTGPTGSGKTTTLYAFLVRLNRPGVKIITLEDPIEYQIEGIIQTPIDKAAGLDFAQGLRSILRQDPDVVMVGEIRDLETAETASQAALTGHVVLSTLHTNDAAGAIPRLLNLGVSPVTLGPALNALIAQRLLRKICEFCKESCKPTDRELKLIKASLAQISPKSEVAIPPHLTFYLGQGCDKCHHIGYTGRIGVFEVFSVDDDMEKLIYRQAPTNDIKKLAISQGMLTMQQDAILKALEGLTDLAEVWRVTEE